MASLSVTINTAPSPESGKIQKHRLIKSIPKSSADSQTETGSDMIDEIDCYGNLPQKTAFRDQKQPEESRESNIEDTAETDPIQANESHYTVWT